MQGDREKSIDAGATDYITKPIDIEELLNCMERWLIPEDNSKKPPRALRGAAVESGLPSPQGSKCAIVSGALRRTRASVQSPKSSPNGCVVRATTRVR